METGSGGGTDLTYLLNFGVLGLFVIAIMTGLLWAKPQVERLIKDKETAEAQRDELLKAMQEQVIPALAEVQSTVVPALTLISSEMKSLRDTIERRVA